MRYPVFAPVYSTRPHVFGSGRHRRSLAGVVAFALLAGCSPLDDLRFNPFGPIECEPVTVSMTGSVIDAVTREAIEGAHVVVPAQTDATTDGQGRFTVTGEADTCENGLYLNISAEGYIPVSVWIPAKTQPRIELYREGAVTPPPD